jgi:hypothetical protein
MLVSHLEHGKHNVLVEAERYPLDKAIQESHSLED